MQIDESVIEPGILSIRTRFDDFTGLYVMHWHVPMVRKPYNCGVWRCDTLSG